MRRVDGAAGLVLVDSALHAAREAATAIGRSTCRIIGSEYSGRFQVCAPCPP
jgi:hypothetical protein